MFKKQEKLPEVHKEDQLDILWMHKPIENSSQVCVGMVFFYQTIVEEWQNLLKTVFPQFWRYIHHPIIL